MESKVNWKYFFAKRFTSFRFAWGAFSLFFSIATFAIVLTDRFQFIDIEWALIVCLAMFLVSSIVLDLTGFRQSINQSESQSNPQMMELCKDVKEIKKEIGLNEKKKVLWADVAIK